MIVNKFILTVCALIWCFGVSAHTLSDEARISLKVVVPNGDMPVEVCQLLENKLTNIITNSGYADNGYIDRFVLSAKIDVLSKDIAQSIPAYVSQKLCITFAVGDVIENKVYSTCSVTLSGIGTNETKSFISAFSALKTGNSIIQEMLDSAKHKIIAFYTDNCSAIISDAFTMATMQQYDKAIFSLISVPNVCNECYSKCRETAIKIYKQKINAESTDLLNKAKSVWTASQDASGAEDVAQLLGRINPLSDNYAEVENFRNSIGNKLRDDAKRKWDFKMKQYTDEQAYKRSIVEAYKAVGISYGNNQPRNIYRTVIRSWWW